MSLAGKKIAMLLDYTYEDLEVLYPKIRLQEEGAEVICVATHPKGTKITGKYGYPTPVDKHISEVTSADFNALIAPGGFAPDYYRRSPDVKNLVSAMYKEGKVLAGICHGPWMFCSAKKDVEDAMQAGSGRMVPLCSGLRMTCFAAIRDDIENAGCIFVDEPVVVDRKVITSRTPQDLIPFVQTIIKEIKS